MPERLRGIHAYSMEKQKIQEHLLRQKMKGLPKYHDLKSKLFIKQKGKCTVCNTELELEEHDLHEHHIRPISEGGSKSKKENLELLHKECHRTKPNATT